MGTRLHEQTIVMDSCSNLSSACEVNCSATAHEELAPSVMAFPVTIKNRLINKWLTGLRYINRRVSKLYNNNRDSDAVDDLGSFEPSPPAIIRRMLQLANVTEDNCVGSSTLPRPPIHS